MFTHLGNLFPADRLREPWESRVSDALFYSRDGTMAQNHEMEHTPDVQTLGDHVDGEN